LSVLIVASTGLLASPDETSSAPQDPAFAWRADWKEEPRWGNRIGYVDAAGNLLVRVRRGSEKGFVTVARDVRDFQLLDWRLAVPGRDGTLRVGEESLKSPLQRVGENVAAFQVTPTRLAFVDAEGTLRVKDGAAEPRVAARGVRSFQVLDTRLAVLGFDGTL